MSESVNNRDVLFHELREGQTKEKIKGVKPE
jgi:hypothetical protein